ncbi:MAG: OB-fold nucleic acid binding domain-containing protein, partial [Acetobacterium sp.]|nr:OB-fold nucleic acid binding domain-containing protein [Acetobacterium sp.]
MTTENLSELLEIRRYKLKKLQEAGNNPFEQTSFNVSAHARKVEAAYDDYEEKEVTMAGRIMSKRGQGKVSFYDLQDSTGRIQLFLKKDALADIYDEIKTYDIGDIVGVKGEIFKTKMGQISVRVSELTLLSKSLQILPEKYHGLKDMELRYRQRYVDLIVNPEVKDVFQKRSLIMRKIREFYDGRDFIEVETPVLSNLAGGANARP